MLKIIVRKNEGTIETIVTGHLRLAPFLRAVSIGREQQAVTEAV